MASRAGSSASLAQSQSASLFAPHHILYVGILVSLVTFFTIVSLIFQTHHYNVSLQQSFFQQDLSSVAAQPVGSIFASKSNPINRIFIKKAWLWTTMAHFAMLFTLRAPLSPEEKRQAGFVTSAAGSGVARKGNAGWSEASATSDSPEAAPEDQDATIASPLAKSFLRWVVATSCWLTFAVWLFGPPLMHRILTSSGGICVPRSDTLSGFSNPSGSASSAPKVSMPQSGIDDAFCYAGPRGISREERPDLFRAAHAVVTDSVAGGRLKGSWQGGHDASGHVFILMLSSLLLLEEATPYLSYYGQAVLPAALSARLSPLLPRSLRAKRDPYRGPRALPSIAATTATLILVGLWVFSLVNTSLYFHTPAEKASGALFALVSWFVLPKGG
ncbi:unnamed protein product [Jaminaea pallidilutea]